MSNHKHSSHITETPDTSHIKNMDVTHETSDVHVGNIFKFVIGLLVLTITTHIGLWGMFKIFNSTAARQEAETPRSPMALRDKERLPPEPRLQSAPAFAEKLEATAPKPQTESATAGAGLKKPKEPMWEIKALREQWTDVLEKGPVDQNGNRYGMPIEKAKEEVLRQLAVRSVTADARKQ